MALSSLDPLGRSGGVLESSTPGALDVFMKRNQQEDDMAGKLMALGQKEAADKAKIDQKKAEAKAKTALTPGTIFHPYKEKYAVSFNDFLTNDAKRDMAFEQGTGTDPTLEGTPAYIERQREIQNLAQKIDSGKQIEKHYEEARKYIMEHQGEFRPGALDMLAESVGDPSHLDEGTFPDLPTNLYDVDKAITTNFGDKNMLAEIRAWATPQGDGSVASGSDTQILPDDLRAVSESLATNPWMSRELVDRYSKYTPEKQAEIDAVADKNNITRDAAMILDQAVARFGAKQEDRGRTAPNDAGYGMAKEEMGAINFIEKGIGMNDPRNRGKSLTDLGPEYETLEKYLAKNPEIQRFSVKVDDPKHFDVFNGYNGMVYTSRKVDNKDVNTYVRGIVRDNRTGETQVVTSSADGSKIDFGKKIPTERFYSEVMDPLAEHDKELDHKAVGYVYQKKYGPIEGREGNIRLPRSAELEVGKNNTTAGALE